jgi:CheY-like chemotaxis protein
MARLAALSQAASHEREPRVQLLLADDDAQLRTLVAAWARNTVAALAVLEAEDGAEAIQLGLQRTPQIALIDVNMPRLGGIDVAITLRELQPQMRLALQTGDPAAHRERARACGLPLFDKLELDRAIRWLESQARWFAELEVQPAVL